VETGWSGRSPLPCWTDVRRHARTPEITVSYWATADHARAWKGVAEHLEGQRLGRERWYEAYRVRIATVEREYGSVARHP
jgi:heme-degrading monooxygenase HmoA